MERVCGDSLEPHSSTFGFRLTIIWSKHTNPTDDRYLDEGAAQERRINYIFRGNKQDISKFSKKGSQVS